jgi:hypothetical protein
MFRREFALMPGLVRGVAAGDRDRAQIIGDHIQGATSALHTHHVLEDDNVWPLLLDRCGESVAPLVELMEGQHHQIATLIPQIDEALSIWRDSPTVECRSVLHLLPASAGWVGIVTTGLLIQVDEAAGELGPINHDSAIGLEAIWDPFRCLGQTRKFGHSRRLL